MTDSTSGESRKRHVTGIPGLDEILKGGLLAGSVYLIRGTPGAGKTIVANQICFHCARQDKRCLYITLLSESHDRLIENIKGLEFYSEEHAERIQYLSGFNVLETDGLGGILRMLADETKRYGTGLVVLDGLFALQEQVDSEREFRLFMNQLQNLSHLSDSTMLLLTNSDRCVGSPEYTMADGWLELAVQQHEYRVNRYIQVHKLRGSAFIGGQHSLTICDAGARILPRLESVANHRPVIDPEKKRLSTGVCEIDKMLGGGVPRGSSTLLVGATGVGKTVFGLHFISQSTVEEPGLIFGFYERKEDLVEKTRALGIDDFGRAIDSGAVEVLWHSPAEHVLDELGKSLVEAIRRRGVKRVFLDGVDALQQSTLHPERIGRFMAALNNLLRTEGVTALFTLETPELVGGEARIQYTAMSAIAQNIILLRYVELSSEIQRTMAVLKARTSHFDPKIRRFAITDSGIKVAGPLKDTDDVLTGHAHPRPTEDSGANE